MHYLFQKNDQIVVKFERLFHGDDLLVFSCSRINLLTKARWYFLRCCKIWEILEINEKTWHSMIILFIYCMCRMHLCWLAWYSSWDAIETICYWLFKVSLQQSNLSAQGNIRRCSRCNISIVFQEEINSSADTGKFTCSRFHYPSPDHASSHSVI